VKKISITFRIILGCFFYILSINLHAENSLSPIGLWRTYDLDNNPRSIVRFYLVGNTLQGNIVKILSTNQQKSSDICTNCPSPWKNKSKLGMTIIWGLKKQGDQWVGGTVLDTDGGNTYSCQITLSPDNKVMYFKAYVAVPLLGKTIEWTRVK